MKPQRGHPLVVAGGRNDAGAFPPLARPGLINPLAPGRAIQAMIHAARVELKDGLSVELFAFAPQEPP